MTDISIYILKYLVVNIRSGSKKFIKVVLRQERILFYVLGQLWWKVLIHFKCWLVYI